VPGLNLKPNPRGRTGEKKEKKEKKNSLYKIFVEATQKKKIKQNTKFKTSRPA